MSLTNKRLLESPEHISNTTKISRVNSSISEVAMPLTAEQSSPINIKEDIVQAIRTSIAEEFRKHDIEKIDPIIKDVAEIKNDIKSFKEERATDQERIKSLEREIKKKNIIFANVPHTQNANRTISEICKGGLKMQGELFIEKSIVLKSNADNNKMLILVEFGSQSAADYVIKNSKLLKGSGIGVSRDLCREDREIRNQLLKIRKILRENDTSQKVNVYGNVIVVNDIKLTFHTNFFGNKRLNINGYDYFLEKFNINCREILECKQ